MKEKPILFNGTMVRAIINCSKTQTRRVVDPDISNCFDLENDGSLVVPTIANEYGEQIPIVCFCPYGVPGDRLWVRETWADVSGMFSRDRDVFPAGYAYRADCRDADSLQIAADYGVKWRPAIHMPRAACRLRLRIYSIRVERLMEVSYADCLSEGILKNGEINNYGSGGKVRDSFAAIWDAINGKKKGCSWTDNPWVWVIDFKRVEFPGIKS